MSKPDTHHRWTVTLPDGSGFDLVVENTYENDNMLAELCRLAKVNASGSTFTPMPVVHVVEVFDRTDGIYVFADLDDAIAFEETVNRDDDTEFGSSCLRTEQVVCDHDDTTKLIESEREE